MLKGIPAAIMAPVGDAEKPEAWQEFRKVISRFEKRFVDFDYVERFAFYQRAKEAFAVVITGEPDGNVILKKGGVAV